MGYDRNDRFDSSYDGRARGRNEYRGRDYARARQGYADDDRGFLDRAGDEVRSWFGDEDAERRRRNDEREDERSDPSGRRDPRPPSREFGRNYDRFGGDRDRPQRWDTQTRHRTGEYGLGVPADAGNGWSFRDRDEKSRDHDPSYRSWRDRQMEAFDRDYEEYRRENQSRFDSEWGSWRQNRDRQRQSLGQVREHQEVVGVDGGHVGTVDHVKGDRILLTKTDKDAGGHHHSIPVGWIKDVGEKVEISKTADEAKAAWREEQDREQGGRDAGRGQDGPHVLDRSFSGTY